MSRCGSSLKLYLLLSCQLLRAARCVRVSDTPRQVEHARVVLGAPVVHCDRVLRERGSALFRARHAPSEASGAKQKLFPLCRFKTAGGTHSAASASRRGQRDAAVARRKLTLRCRASVVGAAGARRVPRRGPYLPVAERALLRKRDGTERRNLEALWSLALEAARLRTARRALTRPPRSPSQVCESPDGRSEYRHLCFFFPEKTSHCPLPAFSWDSPSHQ
jgi:hypothetical protein